MKKFLVLLVLMMAGVGWLYWGNTTPVVTTNTVQLENFPSEFSGLKIIQLSDLHDAEFGEGQVDLIEMVKDRAPDLIFITGDLIDSNRYDLEQSLAVVRGLEDVAPIYYVTGNHEIATKESVYIKQQLNRMGVTVLSNEVVSYTRGNATIEIFGIEDPLNGVSVSNALNQNPRDEGVRLTLSHRPEVFEEYVAAGEQLVFTGHAHGGQIRLWGLGGVIAPGQGFLPAYTAGVYQEGETQMVVSRGLGNSIFPLRVGNRPEIVEVIVE